MLRDHTLVNKRSVPAVNAM